MANFDVNEEISWKDCAENDSSPKTSVHEVHARLKERFSLLSTLGVNTSVTATPLAMGTYLSVIIGVGGSPVIIYGYIVAVTLNLLVCASLSEIASEYPHSSGKIIVCKAPRPIF